MSENKFEQLTVVSVMGHTNYIQSSIYAIQRSCYELPGSKGLLIAPELPEGIILPDNIEYKKIAPFGYFEYNIFILYQLDSFIHTDYCLIVQNDGWVLNGKNWRDEFWDYDYIGAPVPTYFEYKGSKIYQHSTLVYIRNLDWVNNPDIIEPQNGGFSLRSKKLLGLPRKLGLPFLAFPPDVVTEREKTAIEYKMEWKHLIHNEDIFLTVFNRSKLKEAGINFAPSDVAHYFAVESTLISQLRKKDLYQCMGFHGFGNIKFVGFDKIEVHIYGDSARKAQQDIVNFDYIKLLRHCGYKLDIELHPDIPGIERIFDKK